MTQLIDICIYCCDIIVHLLEQGAGVGVPDDDTVD